MKDFVLGITMTLTFANCLLPFLQCLEWRRKGSSAGYSAIMLVFACTGTLLWLYYMIENEDDFGTKFNAAIAALFAFYTLIYWFYHPNRKYLYIQVSAGVALIATIYSYAQLLNKNDRIAMLGNVASIGQMLSTFGMLYEMYRVVFVFQSCEYIDAPFTWGGLVISILWCCTAVLLNDPYILRANAFVLLMIVIQHVLFFIYPPRTWVVPIWGVGGKDKEKMK